MDKILVNNVYYAALWPSNVKKKEALLALRLILSLWAVKLVTEIYEIMFYKYMV